MVSCSWPWSQYSVLCSLTLLPACPACLPMSCCSCQALYQYVLWIPLLTWRTSDASMAWYACIMSSQVSEVAGSRMACCIVSSICRFQQAADTGDSKNASPLLPGLPTPSPSPWHSRQPTPACPQCRTCRGTAPPTPAGPRARPCRGPRACRAARRGPL